MGTFTLKQSPESLNVYMYPESDTCIDFDRFGDAPNYACVDEDRLLPDEDLTYVYTDSPTDGFDVYGLPNQSLSGVINYVQVYARIKSHLVPQDFDGICKILISPDGTCIDTYLSANINLMTAYHTYNYVWVTNPAGGNWSWADIDAMGIGVKCNSPAPSPEIRTTQLYAKVNYTPDEITCILNKPEKISTNHSRNIKMLNFWSGNRAVYDLNRSGKSMVLNGTEYETDSVTDACARIECVRQFGENGSDVTISGLGGPLWNGVYKIRSFGWKHISECPNVYDWILELEDTRYCSECGDGTYD